MALRLRVKKTLLKRKVEGVMQEGFYGRVITNLRGHPEGFHPRQHTRLPRG